MRFRGFTCFNEFLGVMDRYAEKELSDDESEDSILKKCRRDAYYVGTAEELAHIGDLLRKRNSKKDEKESASAFDKVELCGIAENLLKVIEGIVMINDHIAVLNDKLNYLLDNISSKRAYWN